MRKSVLIILALALLISAAATAGGGGEAATGAAGGAMMNPTGLPIVNEKVTYRMAASLAPNWGDPRNGLFWQEMEEETNIVIEWTTFGSSEANEKFNLMMSAGDYPDAFIGGLGGGDNHLVTYGAQGIYIPLEDMIDKYSINLKRVVEEENPDYLKLAYAPDGHIYGMPRSLRALDTDVYNNAFINVDWLNKLGLKKPTTTDEFLTVMKAFRDNDVNGNGNRSDEVPLGFKFADWGAYDHGFYFGAFGYPLNPSYKLVDNGKVVFIGASAGYREAAKWLSKLYAEKLVDQEIFSMDQSQFGAKGSVQPAVYGVFHSWNREIVVGEANKAQYEALMPLTGPSGERHVTVEYNPAYGRNAFIITNKAKNPEILMRWVDEFYRDNIMAVRSTFGPVGEKGDGKTAYVENNKIYIVNPQGTMYSRGQQNLPFAPAIMRVKSGMEIVPEANQQLKNQIAEDYKALGGQKFTSGAWAKFPTAFMTADEAEELSTIDTDLRSYANQRLAAWIVGESSVDSDWDAYLAELDKIGLKKWLELNQKIYDRFASN